MLVQPSMRPQELSNLLHKCKSKKHLNQIHTQILTSNFSDHTLLLTRLLFVYALAEYGCLCYADLIFRRIPNPNTCTWSTMIRAHAVGSTPWRALTLYKYMHSCGPMPDQRAIPFALMACSRLRDLAYGTCVHSHKVKLGLSTSLYIHNALINMYASFRRLDCAGKVFDEMTQRDVVSWNALITGYVRWGELDSARSLFGEMTERNVISWNTMITGFVQAGRAKEALGLFHKMQKMGVVNSDKITMASVISACSSLGALDFGIWVHGYVKRNQIELDMVIRTSLVDMYAKCGSIERAFRVFDEMPMRDVYAWTVMISGLSMHGRAKEALELFREMFHSGTRPNEATFVAVLCACTHGGLVEEGRECFRVMREVYGLEPQAQHYACMVDLLSRVGLIDEAEQLVTGMPIEPDVFIWGALLAGCKMHGRVKLGESIAERLLALEPQSHAFYVLLSNIYAKANRFDDVKRIRGMMRENGIKKIPGCSSIEVDGDLYEFSVNAMPESLMKEIEPVLLELSGKMKLGAM
ncbi:pentatricopeptide repeat-containing protein At5g66520-like [Amborella trichopoda]|uniref:pentatricopeptide repeat-containing protein At5g66520-like n=1 Tax=Amborella trichopoda TaxID=13333 RepID=UPI0009C178B9|nr:pentatricopeptide repeat-containing protein At5g66520-like [Amborella trichopoda]|eukprot:XP_011628422.2 pentatricopeptide repeat-containing protein At5g66520-like [Amborella trichopoda]